MKLRDVDVRPGKVLQVIDNYGNIKASCPGLFSSEDDPELLPPVMPLIKISSTSYCMPHEGDAILVWLNTQNPQELYYTFQGSVEANNKHQLEYGNDDIEILSKHIKPIGSDVVDEDNDIASLIYTSDSGWEMKDGSSSVSVNDGEGVTLQQGNNNYTVKVSDTGITLSGKKGSRAESAILGDSLEELLKNTYNMLEAVQNAAMGNPYSAPIGIAISTQLPELKAQLKRIKSKDVKLT